MMDEKYNLKENSENNIYREELLEYYNNPSNKHKINSPDILFNDENPICGDSVEIYLTLAKEGEKTIIKKASFQGCGCVISMASTSKALEFFEGKNLDEIQRFSKEEWIKKLGIELTPTRVKCALLGINALKKAIIDYEGKK